MRTGRTARSSFNDEMERCARRPSPERVPVACICACRGSCGPGTASCVMKAMSPLRRTDGGVRTRTSLAPDLAGGLDDQPQLGELVVSRELVALLRGGEAALRRQAQLVDVDEPRGLLDAPLEHVLRLELRALGRDQAEHDDLA